MKQTLLDKISSRKAVLGIIGMGYVGVPLAISALGAGYRVLGFDVDAARVRALNAGEAVLRHIPMQPINAARAEGRFEATTDTARLAEPDALLIAVPTPLNKQREPDLSYIVSTAEAIGAVLRPGQLVVLESTTYPGTTEEVMKPILERLSGLKNGVDFFLAFSPEREDPGNPNFGTSTIPKVVGGSGADALDIAEALYGTLVVKTVPVSSTATAEAVKLTENIFRSVNIALVNELKIVYQAMGIDIWEVIDAAKTKPFGFMPFYPGPGLGGHCIPIDPFYLTWKAREYDIFSRFIDLAGQINTRMPYIVVDGLVEAMSRHSGKPLSGSTVLILGIAYKKNIDDLRESPALKLIEILEKRGAATLYHDPHIPVVPRTAEHPEFAGRRSVALYTETLARADAILIAADHDAVDYAAVVRSGKLVLDTRNACARLGIEAANIVKA